MRTRLILAFILVIVLALGTVLIVANLSAETQVQGYLRRFGMGGETDLMQSLADYYRQHQNWAGVESLLARESGQAMEQGQGQGHGSGAGQGSSQAGGMPGQNVIADSDGVIVYAPDPARIGQTLSQSELNTALPVEVDGQVVGYLLTPGSAGGLPANFESQLLAKVRNATLLAALISGVLALILAVVLANQVIKPVKALTQSAERIAQGDLTQQVDVKGPPEVVTLGQTLNSMAASLQRSEKNRRALTADIAHELRTPLAVQQANLEALEDGVYPPNQEALKPLREQNELLIRLVEDLRTLSLADAGELELHKRPVDLRELTHLVTQSFEPALANNQITLQIESVGEMPKVMADPDRIQQILHNLLQNALRYTPTGKSIEINLQQEGKYLRLDLRDHGAGIPPEALDLIFERFYRADSSREHASGSTGLGLAIARKLAEAHGGTLTAFNHPQGGVVFTLRLPI
ncbi:MAG TPA: two-component sensor histidine kinase [Anaerolineaceae bacterium]|nr:two-component sensor histidine kinase [Anaerolineaceae bacterium]